MSGTADPAKRPRQVTTAGVVAAIACGLLVASLFDTMAGVRSVETQDSVRSLLERQSGLGISVADVIVFLRGLVLASGALAAAGVVMAIYTLRRHRAARVGLTIAAVLMLFSTTFVSGLLPVVIAACAAMLWSREARDWFDGTRSGAAAASGGAAARPDPFARSPLPPLAEPTASPSPTGVDLAGPDLYASPPEPWSMPPPAVTGDRRPRTVTVAACLTVVFSALALLVFGLLVTAMVLDHDGLVSALQQEASVSALNLSGQEILSVLWVLSAVCISWSLAAIALAVLTVRGVGIARVALAVSAGLAGLAGFIAIPVGWLHAAAAVATAVLLFTGGANEWFAGRRRSGESSGPPSSGSSPGPSSGPVEQPSGDKPPVW